MGGDICPRHPRMLLESESIELVILKTFKDVNIQVTGILDGRISKLIEKTKKNRTTATSGILIMESCPCPAATCFAPCSSTSLFLNSDGKPPQISVHSKILRTSMKNQVRYVDIWWLAIAAFHFWMIIRFLRTVPKQSYCRWCPAS